MSTQHEISEFIENLPLKKVRCKGYRPDDVYDAVYRLSTMYNQLLSEVYQENEDLKKQMEEMPNVALPEAIPETVEEAQEQEPLALLSSKELRKLKRTELLELMLMQSKEKDALKQEIEDKNLEIRQLKKQLDTKKIDLQKAGTIAEASFKMNGVLESAEKAAQQYLENIQELHDKEKALYTEKKEEFENRCTAVMQATIERCNFMKEEMESKCSEMWETTEKKCLEREKESEERCTMLDQKAKDDVDRRWNDLSRRLEEFYASHEGLRELLAKTK